MAITIDGTTGVSAVQAGVVTQADLAPNVAGNGPCFGAYQSVAQTVPAAVDTKISLQTEEFDLTAAFDAVTNYKFQPNIPGYYQLQGGIYFNTAGLIYAAIYKNGVLYKRGIQAAAGTYATGISALIYLNGTTDYTELYGYNSVGSTIPVGAPYAYFSGFLARSA